jgi:hypothetical protein
MSEDTESLMSDREYSTFARGSSQEKEENVETKKQRYHFTTWSLLAAAGLSAVVLIVVILSSNNNISTDVSLSSSSTSKIVKETKGKGTKKGSADGTIERPSYLKMDMYKHTSSISAGTYASVAAKGKAYIAPLVSTSDLGCGETYKLVFDVKHVSGTNGHFAEIHFVDSSRFREVGKSFGEWADFIESLGTEVFNVFMHNKVQMFVPDVSPLFRKLQDDGMTAFYRLSKSPGSLIYDVAHVGVPIQEAVTIFEMVGPISTLTDEELAFFTPWSDAECSDANNIARTLVEYQALYDQMATTATEVAWSALTGLYVPMAIAIYTPTSSVDHMYDHLEAGTLIVGGEMTETTISSTCSMITVDFDREEGVDGYNPIVRYIENSAALQGGLFTLANWEDEVEDTHSATLTQYDAGGYQGWNHYLDNHIGILTEVNYTDPNYCATTKAFFEDVLLAYDVRFAPRMRGSTHYYSGFNGIRSWEFNVEDCISEKWLWDICGCIAANNNMEYKSIYNEICTIQTTMEQY